MEATGIVRRLDDLGRVVIPKEIRRVMNWQDGNPIEIIPKDDGTVTLKSYFENAVDIKRIMMNLREVEQDVKEADVRLYLDQAIDALNIAYKKSTTRGE